MIQRYNDTVIQYSVRKTETMCNYSSVKGARPATPFGRHYSIDYSQRGENSAAALIPHPSSLVPHQTERRPRLCAQCANPARRSLPCQNSRFCSSRRASARQECDIPRISARALPGLAEEEEEDEEAQRLGSEWVRLDVGPPYEMTRRARFDTVSYYVLR